MGIIAIKCPSCGADVSLDESREFGFCTYCGTKVMQDKLVVEHKGKVKVDNSEYVEKFLQNARRAYAKEDWEEVEKYYNLVEQNAPYNMEAVFFSAYGKAMLSLTDSDYYKRQQKFTVLINSISVINDYFEETNEDKEAVLNKICDAIIKMFSVNYVYNIQAADVGGKSWQNKLLNTTKEAFLTELKQIAEIHSDSYIQELINKINNIQSQDGCYVATAVYGSYDCPQVWTLRRFRDYSLAETWHGRAFIRTYYAISPTLVKWFGDKEWFKKMWRGRLDKMVENLLNEGYENTPYEDKNW